MGIIEVLLESEKKNAFWYMSVFILIIVYPHVIDNFYAH